jgi:hypothetical protein
MPTLQDVQARVNEAQAKIKEGDSNRVQTVIWPAIKIALSQTTDLEWKYRGDMAKLIYKRLNDQTLHAMPTSINVERLKADLEAERVPVPEPTQVYKWLPW